MTAWRIARAHASGSRARTSGVVSQSGKRKHATPATRQRSAEHRRGAAPPARARRGRLVIVEDPLERAIEIAHVAGRMSGSYSGRATRS